MEWLERRDGDFLISRSGKILGRVAQCVGTSIWRAEAVYAAGGDHKVGLGDYISVSTARKAAEDHTREIKLPGTEDEKA